MLPFPTQAECGVPVHTPKAFPCPRMPPRRWYEPGLGRPDRQHEASFSGSVLNYIQFGSLLKKGQEIGIDELGMRGKQTMRKPRICLERTV